MPRLVFSQEQFTEYAVIKGAYEWFFVEPNSRVNPPLSENYEDIFIASIVERQIELFPQTQAVTDDYFLFKYLADKWQTERGATSSLTAMVLCPAYQSIIGMGPKAIPFIISRLAAEGNNPDHWSWALQALTGVNPVSEDDSGNLVRMARSWLDWAASEGYAW